MTDLVRSAAGSLMRTVIFPNVVALGTALVVGIPTQSVPALVAAMIVGYLVGCVAGRRIWPPTARTK